MTASGPEQSMANAMSSALGRHQLLLLNVVRTLHTIVWAFFAACIFAIPAFAWRDRYDMAWILIGVVVLEVLVLLYNHWRCPLTDVAARYTSDRPDNFDIYLPLWLARYNKVLFGWLFLAGVLFTVFSWFLHEGAR